MRKKGVLFIAAALWASAAQCGPPLRRGDLLFRADKGEGLSEAIEGVSPGRDGVRFSHVGIVDIQDGDTTVIEAVFGGVRRTALKDFLSEAALRNGAPTVVVERLVDVYAGAADMGAQRAATFIGRPYDEAYLPGNDAYYCTELVQASYRDAAGRSIFPSKPMTFKDNRTGEIPQAWIDFFDARGLDIPEGVAGTNPGDMSADSALIVVYSFFRRHN